MNDGKRLWRVIDAGSESGKELGCYYGYIDDIAFYLHNQTPARAFNFINVPTDEEYSPTGTYAYVRAFIDGKNAPIFDHLNPTSGTNVGDLDKSSVVGYWPIRAGAATASKVNERVRQQALSKLTESELEALGL